MPSTAYGYLVRVSIAFIVIPTAILLTGSALANDSEQALATASGSASLPALQNTRTMDRYFSREVSDSFIFGESANPSINNAGESESITTVAQQETESASTTAPLSNAEASPEATMVRLDPEEPWIPIFDNNDTPGQSAWNKIEQSDRLTLAQNDRVRFYQNQYKRESLWISKILHRGKPYLSHLVATLDQRFMPVELALLPAIESGYQPTARSAGHAAGLWQIVPITAREIGVHRGPWFDGRGDILASTTAAIDYLSYLSAEFNGDWELTLAAYNAGPGRVRSAIKKNVKAGLPTDYWSLDLPRETMNYVPKFIALVDLVKQPEISGFDMPEVPMEAAFESIDVGFRVSLDKVAKIADIDVDLLRALNAGLIHGVTAPDGPHQLLIPTGTGEQFQIAFANVQPDSMFAEPLTHDVVDGDTISSIALKYGLSQRALLNMNGLDNAKINIGQKLAVLDHRSMSESVIEYVVSIGDTLSEIAYKFSVDVGNISMTNGDLPKDHVIHPGDTLNVLLSNEPAG